MLLIGQCIVAINWEIQKKTMRYLNLAERDSSMLNFVRQYEASAYLMQKDTTKYLKALQEGFKEYPNFAFFFPRLVEYYVKNGDNQWHSK